MGHLCLVITVFTHDSDPPDILVTSCGFLGPSTRSHVFVPCPSNIPSFCLPNGLPLKMSFLVSFCHARTTAFLSPYDNLTPPSLCPYQTEIRAVVFIPGQPHAVSAASGERQVAVWEVPPAKKSKKQHPAITTLHLEDPATQLDAACVSEGETFNVAAVSEGGEAYVWLCHREAASAAVDGSDGKAGIACQLVMRVRVGDAVDKGYGPVEYWEWSIRGHEGKDGRVQHAMYWVGIHLGGWGIWDADIMIAGGFPGKAIPRAWSRIC